MHACMLGVHGAEARSGEWVGRLYSVPGQWQWQASTANARTRAIRRELRWRVAWRGMHRQRYSGGSGSGHISACMHATISLSKQRKACMHDA